MHVDMNGWLVWVAAIVSSMGVATAVVDVALGWRAGDVDRVRMNAALAVVYALGGAFLVAAAMSLA